GSATSSRPRPRRDTSSTAKAKAQSSPACRAGFHDRSRRRSPPSPKMADPDDAAKSAASSLEEARPPKAANRLEAMKREIGNLPNMITIGRLFLIPPCLLLMREGDPVSSFLAMLVFLFAAFLDLVDGWLARRRGLVTFFGKFVD